MNLGDTLYYVETNDANLEHQPDGVDLFKGEVINTEDDEKSNLYFLTKKLIFSVGKGSYSRHGKKKERPVFSSIGTRFRIPFAGRKVFDNLLDAQKEMIGQIFEQENDNEAR